MDLKNWSWRVHSPSCRPPLLGGLRDVLRHLGGVLSLRANNLLCCVSMSEKRNRYDNRDPMRTLRQHRMGLRSS
jgi:hypothetical protein